MPASNIREHILVMGQSNIDARIPGPNPYADGGGNLVNIQVYNTDTSVMGQWTQGVNVGAASGIDTRWAFDSYVLTAWRDHLGTPLSVVKNTKGGTSLRPNNSSGTWHTVLSEINQNYDKLYFELISKIHRVRAIDARAGFVSKFPIVLWHQGESDVSDPYVYAERLTILIQKVRELTWNPNQVWFSGSVPTNSLFWSNIIFAENQDVEAADPNFHFIDLGAGTFTDGIHFDAAYAATVGGLYYNRMLTEL